MSIRTPHFVGIRDIATEHCIQPNDLDLLLKKGVYPYDYMSAWDRFEETKFSAKTIS